MIKMEPKEKVKRDKRRKLYKQQTSYDLLFLSFRRVLYVVCILLGTRDFDASK
jgi:hypothetical protein